METVKINMVPKGAVKAAHASQGDAPRVVRFELFDELLPYTLDGSEDITLTVVRPDTEEIVSPVNNTEEAYIDVSFTSEMTAIRGVANCGIKISKSGAEIGSHNFDLNIERGAYGEDITVETASGVIATFTTGVIDNLVGLKTTFEPKQDLHGYLRPWPAGAGKNKLFLTTPDGTYIKSGITYKINNDGTVETSGTATADDYLLLWNKSDADNNKLLPDGNYVLNGCPSGGSSTTFYIATNGFGGVSDTGSGGNFTIDSSLLQTNILISVKNGTNMNGKVFKPMIRLSTESDPAYEPYENICDIDGIDEINLFHTGVNLFGGEFEIGHRWEGDGTYSTQANRNAGSPNKIPCKPNTTYAFIMNNISQTTYMYLSEFDKNDNHIQKGSGNAISTSTKYITFTTGANTYFIAFSLYANTDFTSTEISEISVNYPATETEYKAYTGESALVEIDQEVYGGYYDKDLGIVLTSKLVDLGSLTYGAGFGGFYTGDLKNEIKIVTNVEIPNLLSSIYKAIAYSNLLTDKNTVAIVFGGADYAYNGIVVFNDTRYPDAASFKAGVNGVTLCYELKDPIIIPADKVNLTTVKGVNNVWSDTNGETEVKFYVKEA